MPLPASPGLFVCDADPTLASLSPHQQWRVSRGGAIRPSLLVLLLPLWIFQLSFHRRNWKVWLGAVGIVITGTLAWLIPTVWLTGGMVNI